MHILIITPFFAPDIGPSAPLFTMLSSALVEHGNQVTVVSAVPHFATGKVDPQFRGVKFRKALENGVSVIRVPVPSLERSKLLNRLIQFFFFQIGSTLATLFNKYDCALITNPALETFIPFVWHAHIRNKPVIWSVFDVYPDVGIKLGIFRSRFVIFFVRLLEQICLKKSAFVQIITDSFKPGLQKLNVPDSKLALIPIWIDTGFIHPLPKSNPFAQEHQLDDKFVVLYAGNIGLSQGLQTVLSAAEMLQNHEKLRFVFVGNGAGLAELQAQAQQRELKNVQFIPFQARERLPEVLATADISLVILKRGIGSESLPSKTFSALASARPIIASVDQDSETWRLIQQAQAGICILPEEPAALAEAIRQLMEDAQRRSYFGQSGRKWAEEFHSLRFAAEQFEKLFIKSLIKDFSPNHSTMKDSYR